MKLHRYVTIGLLSLSFQLMAATTQSSLCKNFKEPNFFKDLIIKSENRLPFNNHGGLLNGGVCWWHSRFTRNALYLAVFDADKERPTEQEAKKLIHQIRKGKKVVEIPGFKNLEEFAYHFQSLVQKELEKWQIKDGFVNQQWIVGLWGGTHTSAENLEKKMDKLYSYVHDEHKIAYQKIQIKGIDAHAWLVVDMLKKSNGYVLKVVDSNSSDIRFINYRKGSTSIYDRWYGDIVPYTGRKRELKRAEKAVVKYCSHH